MSITTQQSAGAPDTVTSWTRVKKQSENTITAKIDSSKSPVTTKQLNQEETTIVTHADSIVDYVNCYYKHSTGINSYLLARLTKIQADTSKIKNLNSNIESMTKKYQLLALNINLLNTKLAQLTGIENPLQVSEDEIFAQRFLQPATNYTEQVSKMLHIFLATNTCLSTLKEQTLQYSAIIRTKPCKKLTTEEKIQISAIQDYIMDSFKTLSNDTIIGNYLDTKYIQDGIKTLDSQPTPTIH